MSITIELSPEQEARIKAAAAAEGVTPAEWVSRSLLADVPAPPAAAPSGKRTLELLARWAAEDATDDPEEIRKAEAELRDLKNALNETRASTGARLVFP